MTQPLPGLKILAVVEATTVNAVGKNVLDFYEAARELNQRNSILPAVEVSIATFDRTASGQAPNEFVASARAIGVHVDVISERGRFDRHIIRVLREIAEEQDPDIIVTHSVKSHFVILRSGLWRALPWVAFHHGYTSTDLKMRFYNLFDRRSLPKADRVITVCEAFAQELAAKKRVPRDRISVQHNSIRPHRGASSEEVESLRKQLAVKSDERIVLAVGRLSKEKAHFDLIRAFKLLCERNPQFSARLIIVGEGPERERLEAAANASGIRERIIFAGQLRNVQPYYAIADVLANSSHSEGSPYVLLEALATGLPIVATAVGGVPEMLKDEESALLVPARDDRAMLDAMARILVDPSLAQKLKTNASALVVTRFSPDTYVRTLTEIYRKVIDGRTLR